MTDIAGLGFPHIAVLVPCYNEELAIPTVVRDFRKALPDAAIYVYDNNSRDRTIEVARSAGALIGAETVQGKGNVIRRMFADVEADVYVMVDGDDTYDAAAAPRLISILLDHQLDMVNARRATDAVEAYRAGHRLGNKLLSSMVYMIFGDRCRDVLSGYRVLSRRFVKSFPALSTGFEIETELTIHALELRMPMAEVDTTYKARSEGSVSKLRTYRDGVRILLEHLPSRERRAAVAVLQRDLSCARIALRRDQRSDFRHLFRDRPRPALSDCGVGDRDDARGVFEPGLRSRAGHGDARPARSKAHALSRLPGAAAARLSLAAAVSGMTVQCDWKAV